MEDGATLGKSQMARPIHARFFVVSLFFFAFFFCLCVCGSLWCLSNILIIMADVIRSVRVYKIENSGDLVDKCKSDVDILCEYDPQGVNIKIISGKCVIS